MPRNILTFAYENYAIGNFCGSTKFLHWNLGELATQNLKSRFTLSAKAPTLVFKLWASQCNGFVLVFWGRYVFSLLGGKAYYLIHKLSKGFFSKDSEMCNIIYQYLNKLHASQWADFMTVMF